MGIRHFLFVSIIVLAFGASARADDAMRIVVFGDTLTSGQLLQPQEGLAARLQKKLKDIGYSNIEVLNMSVAGETSTGGLDRLQSVLLQNPDIVLVELAGNDILRGTNPNLISRNLGSILSTLRERKIYTILIGMKAPANMNYGYSEQVDTLYNNLVRFHEVPFYLFAPESMYDKPEMNLADGFHPNAQGVDAMIEGLYRLVDAGLRWVWQVREYEQRYKEYMSQQPQVPSAPRP